MSKNPVRIEYTGDNVYNGQTFSTEKKNFLLNLDRNIVGFTGNYKKVGNNKYSLQTFIYQIPNFSSQTNLEFDSKIFLQENPDKTVQLLEILQREFWNKGWIHGDLDTSNIVIQYKDNQVFFRIFDFEEINYKTPQNNVKFLKFVWSDIRKFMEEYIDLKLVRHIETKKCYWLYKDKYFFNTDNNLEYLLCNSIDMNSDKIIDVSKIISNIIKFLDRFSVYKYLYFLSENEITDFKVVNDEMILSELDIFSSDDFLDR